MAVSKLTTYRNLDSLNRIQDKQSEPAIENISFPDGIEVSTSHKVIKTPVRILGVCLTERIPVSAEPVVTYRLKPAGHLGPITAHTTVDKAVNLLFNSQWGFDVLQKSSRFRQKRKPAEVSMLRRINRGPAGLL